MKRTYEVATGMVVIDARGIEVAMETMSPKADYAGVVADRDGEVPNILFFSETPVEAYSCNDEDAVVDKLAAVRPALKAVRGTEVSLDAVNGKDITLEDWASKMRLGIFAVPTVSDEKSLWNGIGIIRHRRE